MSKSRKISDIWQAIEHLCPQNINKTTWKQSYEYIKAAIEYIGYVLITTKEEFDTLQIPMDKSGINNYSRRKIIVSRNGIQSKPTRIESLLTGHCKLLTTEELNVIKQRNGADHSLNQPKGSPTSNDKELNAINKLHILLDIDTYLEYQHLLEFRISDIAYRFKNDENYVADQVKSSYIYTMTKNQISFNITIGEMLTIFEKNMSLTCIAIKNDKVEVVWFFYGLNAINILKTFDKKQLFNPTIHSKFARANPFTITINEPMYRYDVGKSESEIKRLLEQKLNFTKIGVKHSIQYFNEDDSQIICASHRVEHKSFAMTRDACSKINVSVEKISMDNYTCIDFRMNDTIKIQDKSYKKDINMRHHGRLPYNPDTFDIFQCSNLITNEVYAVPMRYIENDIVKSTFPPEILMKNVIRISTIWDAKYGKYKYDLKNEKDVRAYVENCKAAAAIPELSDRNFYQNMIDANADKFGSPKKINEQNRKIKTKA
jgi:hypothetical protein